MEKPSPVYNFSSRFQNYTREDRSDEDRYTDRMTLRGIPVLRDTDEEAVPMWRGDHSFSSDAASYSLTHFIEPEVAREHPTWSHEKVKETAVERFEKRLRQDLAYEKKEVAHEESVVAWRPVQTPEGKWELATQYGDKMVTLSELWEHTREYAAFAGNPAAYNKEEHKAQLVMQDKLIDGSASGFVSVLSHPDSVRYVQVWQKAEDGSITSKQVDIYKSTGRDFTHEEGVKFIDHLASFHQESSAIAVDESASYAHFFIHHREIHEEDIRMIAVAQTMETRTKIVTGEVQVPKNLLDIGGDIVIRDTTDSMLQLGVFLRGHIDRKIAAFKSIGEKKGKKILFTTDKIVTVNKSEKFIAPLPLSEKKSDKKQSDEYAKEPSVSTETMKSVAAEWWITTSMLQHRESIPVAPVAILFWLTAMSKEQKVPAIGTRIPMESDKSKGEPEPGKKEKKKRVTVRSIFRLIKNFGEKTIGATLGWMPVHESGVRQVVAEKKQEVTGVTHEKVTRILPPPMVDKLIRMLRYFSRDMAGIRMGLPVRSLSPEVSGSVDKKRIIQQEAVPYREQEIKLLTRELGVAVIVWLLIDFGTGKYRVPGDNSLVREGVPADEEILTEIAQRETPWLLLAIIWYLSAIREHGKSAPIKKKKSGKKKTNQHALQVAVPLPPSGVIFMYGS